MDALQLQLEQVLAQQGLPVTTDNLNKAMVAVAQSRMRPMTSGDELLVQGMMPRQPEISVSELAPPDVSQPQPLVRSPVPMARPANQTVPPVPTARPPILPTPAVIPSRPPIEALHYAPGRMAGAPEVILPIPRNGVGGTPAVPATPGDAPVIAAGNNEPNTASPVGSPANAASGGGVNIQGGYTAAAGGILGALLAALMRRGRGGVDAALNGEVTPPTRNAPGVNVPARSGPTIDARSAATPNSNGNPTPVAGASASMPKLSGPVARTGTAVVPKAASRNTDVAAQPDDSAVNNIVANLGGKTPKKNAPNTSTRNGKVEPRVKPSKERLDKRAEDRKKARKKQR